MAMLADNEKMTSAYEAVVSASEDIRAKGESFIAELTNALSTFEGDTKDALMSSKIGSTGSETEGTLAYFVEQQIPSLIDGLAQLLEGNRNTIDESDQKLAEAIKG